MPTDRHSRKSRRSSHATTPTGHQQPVEDAAFVKIMEVLSAHDVQMNSDKKLGTGSYSSVFKATYKGAEVAVKMIDKRAGGEYVQRFMQRELDIIRTLEHENIVQVYQICRTHDFVAIVEELAHHGDLLSYMRTKPKGYLTEADARPLFRQLIEAIQYLGSLHIVHRDIKCENVFLDANYNVKLGDFGFTRTLRPGEFSMTHCGSKTYAALEILTGRPYTGNAVDIWSSGIVLYCMLTGNFPYGGNTDDVNTIVGRQRRRSLRFPSRLSSDVRELIRSMLHPDPVQRATTEQILGCNWMADPDPD